MGGETMQVIFESGRLLSLVQRQLVAHQLPNVFRVIAQSRLLLQAAALRIRMDEEAREIDRLQKRGSERLADRIEASIQ